MWPVALSGRLPVEAMVGRYPAIKLIGCLLYTSSKNEDYLSFVRSREKSLSRGKNATVSYLEQLESTSDAQNGVLKMSVSYTHL